jgi:hypothetical protein
MKSRGIVCGLLVAIGLLVGVQLFGQTSPTVKNPSNPPMFQKYAAPVSSRIAFFASEKGKQTLLSAPNPIAKTILQRYWGKDVAAQWDKTPHKYIAAGSPSAAPSKGNNGPSINITPASTSRCPATRFNLEPRANALPQNEESIAFKFQGGSSTAADMAVEVANDFRGFFKSPAVFSPSISGYYYIDTAGCTPRVEGGTPPITDAFYSGNKLIGAGDPIVNYDSVHDAWFYSSIYESPYDSAIGIFRNTTANLKNTANCPNGTHNLLTSTTCWPTSAINLVDEQVAAFPDKPDSWVDTRASGTGAGDVYITDTLFSYGSQIDLIACNNALTACSAPEIISGSDYSTQFSDIKTKASDGTITVTYANFYTVPTFTQPIYTVDIKYVTCVPNGAPSAPTCNFPVLVATDYKPIVDGLADLTDVRNGTYPVHVETPSGTYVIWEHCGPFSDLPFGDNTICPDADIVGAFSSNGGVSWTAPFAVDATIGHAIFPWASYDSSTNTVIVVEENCNNGAKNNCSAGYRTIIPPATAVSGFNALVSATYPEAEANRPYFAPLFGDYMGASAHNGHLWVGYGDTLTQGTYGYGTSGVNESNNGVAAVDAP